MYHLKVKIKILKFGNKNSLRFEGDLTYMCWHQFFASMAEAAAVAIAGAIVVVLAVTLAVVLALAVDSVT